MNLLKKLTSLFSPPRSYDPAFELAVRCNRCGELIHARLDLRNDLSIEYDEQGGAPTYICRKMLMGSAAGERPCFQRVEVELTFDANRNLVSREISGGTFANDAAG